MNNVVVCTDNSYTWRNKLTIGKEYEVIRSFPDPHADYSMFEIKCDDSEVSVYRANRFKEQT
ncbi:hypothetical protein PPSC2_26790 (plasmid) [Paenibacillus polymyxa SC2]|uniref:Uncharacterized protein n=1 Tax=Paenibacillus polymyxa (strain SC2) TaxID=886882 RepID=A0A0D5ZCM6_PAEPS|nr:hypothetical protein PPSC2_26790 [Paenibacillus polymyxa SC2]